MTFFGDFEVKQIMDIDEQQQNQSVKSTLITARLMIFHAR